MFRSFYFLVFLIFFSVVGATPMLRLAIVLTRHGDRTPLKVFPNTLAKWPEGLGVLTKVGTKQHMELGSSYRQRYVYDNQLVSKKFHDPEIHVRSTGKQRTLMSAYSFMSGFFPPTHENDTGIHHGIQPVPIYSEGLKTDKLIYAYKSCSLIDRLREKEQEKEHWLEKTKAGHEHLQELSSILGKKIHVRHCSTILNNINAERIHGRPSIPELVNNEDLMKFVRENAEFSLKQKYATREMGKLGVGTLMQYIHERMETKLDKENETPSFILLSGHDGTILTLFAAMGIIDAKLPDYAASVAFELYQEKESAESAESSAFVKTFYDFHPLSLPGCGEICSLSEFKKLADDSTEFNPEYHCERVLDEPSYHDEL